MAIIVPSLTISGTLPTTTGSISIYTGGAKGNNAAPGDPVTQYWQDLDANVVGQALIDIVNDGTVRLFSSASVVSSALGVVSASQAAVSSAFWPLSSAFYPVSGGFWALSASLSHSSGTLTAAGYYAFSASVSSALRSINIVLGTSSNDVSSLSWSMYGDQVGDFGISGTVLALSAAFYGSDIPSNEAVSGALVMISQMFLGSRDLVAIRSGTGGVSGSHPTGTFNNLREAFYSLTSSFNSLSSTVSGNQTGALFISSSFISLSGNLDLSAAYWNSASEHVYSRSLDIATSDPTTPLYGINSLIFSGTNALMLTASATATLYIDSPTNSQFISVSSAFYALSGTYPAVSSAASGNVVTGSQLSGVLYPLSSAFYELSGTYPGVSGAASSSVATGSQLSSTLYPLSSAFYALSGTYPGVSGAASASVNVSLSLSGVLGSSSLYTPSQIYLKSPNGSIWKISIDNTGILSSTLV